MFKTFFSVIVISCICSTFAFSAVQNPPNTHTHADHTVHPDHKDKQAATHKTLLVTDQQLEEIIDKLSPEERASIAKLQKEIAEWPKSVFEEISNYREFVMTARKIAIEKHNNLTPEARTALEREKAIKAQLTPATIHFLETVQLRSVQKTN